MRRVFWVGLILATIFLLPIGAGMTEEAALEIALPQEQDAALDQDNSAFVTMEFEDADMRDVVRVIALASGMNVVIGEDVQAKVTISLKDVHWEKALDVILRTYNFTYKKEENLIRIMTLEKLKQEERDIPLATKIVYLNFADVSDLKGTLSTTLSDRGSIQVDTRTNGLLITDIPAKVKEAEAIAKKLDSRTPQVLIEAMLVDVKLTEDDELGVNWKILNMDRPENQFSSSVYNENYLEQPSGTMNSLSSQSINFGFLKTFSTYGIDGLISAWVKQAKANVLASPKIVTLDNKTAKIEIKSQAPYTQSTQSDSGGTTTSTQFKDVITGLEVTPHITKEGFISMNVKPKQEFIEEYVGSSNEPQIGSRSAETNVLVSDGETIVIGGLRKVEDNLSVTKVPLLGDLPLVGKFFRKTDKQRINTELLMFVTPRIIVNPQLTDEEMGKFRMLDEARWRFLRYLDEEEEKERLERQKYRTALISPGVEAERLLSEEEMFEITDEDQDWFLPKYEEEAPDEAFRQEEYIYSW